MNGIEILIESLSEYTTEMTSTMMNSKILGAAAGTASKIWLNNTVKKQPYKMILEGFMDETGNIVSHEELFQAFKDIIKAKPLVIANIKFNDKDIEAIQEIFESKL